MLDTVSNVEQVFASLQHFKHYKHELIFFHVFDKNIEEELKLEDRPHKFVDLETGKQLKLNPLDIRGQYAASSKKTREDLKVKCGKYGIDYVEADINKGLESILIPYLFKRSKLF
jgi:hypothetical protein